MTDFDITHLKSGVNFGGYGEKSIKVNDEIRQSLFTAASKDGDAKHLSGDEIDEAMASLKEAGYNITDDKNEFMSMLGVSVTNSEKLKSSKTDESTGLTTNKVKTDSGKKWVNVLDENGRLVSGKSVDGCNFTVTYSDTTYTINYDLNDKYGTHVYKEFNIAGDKEAIRTYETSNDGKTQAQRAEEKFQKDLEKSARESEESEKRLQQQYHENKIKSEILVYGHPLRR